jgi:hypothetical protein
MSRRLSTFFGGSASKDPSPERHSPPLSSKPSNRSLSPGKLRSKASAAKLSKNGGSTADRVPSSTLAPPPAFPVPNSAPTTPTAGPTIQQVAAAALDAPAGPAGGAAALDDAPLPPPPTITAGGVSASGSPAGSRPGSRSGTPAGSRPGTPRLRPQSSRGTGGLGVPEEKEKKRRSWFGGGVPKAKEKDEKTQVPLAWVVAHQEKVPYNMSLLLNAEKVC